MQFYDVIENRASIKEYKNTPINKEKLARMINAAMMSPSWKNNTSYKLILVDDPKERELLSRAVINETDDAARSIIQAPMAAVIVANPEESGIVEGREYYLVDSAIALEHFVLAATNEGYGTCWIASIDEEQIKRVLAIPDKYRVVAITPIGEPAENKAQHIKKDVRDYVFLNTWGKSYTENIYS
jgi:nitroreductase